MVGWSVAFGKAKLIEEEGRKLVDGNNNKRKLTNDDADKAENEKDNDDDNDEEGGFNQPHKLARFLRSVKQLDNNTTVVQEKNDNHTINDNDNHQEQQQNDNNQEQQQNDNINRQICRIWLKHKYLGSSISCDEQVCKRKHKIDINTDNLGRLYKDYSFKGLTQGQRQKIINQIKNENSNDNNNNNESSVDSNTNKKRKKTI